MIKNMKALFYKSAILSISLLLLFYACKKEEPIRLSPTPVLIPPPPPIPKLFPFTEKKFYCQHHSFQQQPHPNGGYFGNSIMDRDIVVKCTIIDNNLMVFGRVFPIDIDSQSVFNIINNSDTLRLSFFNNFDSISFSHRWHWALGKDDYSGAYTQLRESFLPHAYEPELHGDYLLNIKKNDCRFGIDTFYTDSLYISTSANYLAYDNRSFREVFHSYVRQEFQSTAHAIYNVYWAADSLYIDEFVRTFYNECNIGGDTLHYTYQGRKL